MRHITAAVPRSPVLAVSGLVALVVAGQGSAAICVALAGDFSSVGVVGPPCASPILLCTDGQLTGDLDAQYAFTMESMAPALAPEDPTRLVFTGHSEITTAAGTMTAQDVGKMWAHPSGTFPFLTIVQVQQGTGAYAGASGFFVAEGALDMVTAQATGTWTAVLCWEWD